MDTVSGSTTASAKNRNVNKMVPEQFNIAEGENIDSMPLGGSAAHVSNSNRNNANNASSGGSPGSSSTKRPVGDRGSKALKYKSTLTRQLSKELEGAEERDVFDGYTALRSSTGGNKKAESTSDYIEDRGRGVGVGRGAEDQENRIEEWRAREQEHREKTNGAAQQHSIPAPENLSKSDPKMKDLMHKNTPEPRLETSNGTKNIITPVAGGRRGADETVVESHSRRVTIEESQSKMEGPVSESHKRVEPRASIPHKASRQSQSASLDLDADKQIKSELLQ